MKGSDEVGYSHHITASTYQQTAWCNVLEKTLSSAVDRAAASCSEFRAGLPVGFLGYMGSWHGTNDIENRPRTAFKRHFRALLKQLEDFIDLDEVCDELGVELAAGRLPPPRPSKSMAPPGNGGDAPRVTLDTRVRFVDASAVRPMVSSDPDSSEPTVMLFHTSANSQVTHMNKAVEAEEDVGCLRFDAATFLPALRMLTSVGSSSVRCGDLPLDEEGDRTALCENLHEAGLLQLLNKGD